MEKNQDKRDLRVVKTYEKLRGALGTLMRAKPYEDISVIDICEAANVRRATFYRHFADKHDFIMHSVEVIAEELTAIATEKYGRDNLTDYIVGYVRELFIYLSDKRDITDNIFKSRGASHFHEIILAATQKLLLDELIAGEKMGIHISDSRIAVAAFVNGGITNMVASFIRNKEVNTGAFLRELKTILDKLFSVD